MDVDQATVTRWTTDFMQICEEHNCINFPDFEIPIYNVWKQQNKSNAVNHFGNSVTKVENKVVENLPPPPDSGKSRDKAGGMSRFYAHRIIDAADAVAGQGQ